jgi:disulfide bond formation protein DsbB
MDLMDFVFPVVDALSVLTLIGGIIVLVLLVSLLIEALTHRRLVLLNAVSQHAFLFMLVVALAATCGSLFLSEIAQWAPCKLCWFQRIFMYPQVVVLAIALWKRDRTLARVILAFALIGMVFSVIHYVEQIHATFFAPPEALEPCDASGVPCAQTYTFRFGYITVPMMALTAFVMNALASIVVLRRR